MTSPQIAEGCARDFRLPTGQTTSVPGLRPLRWRMATFYSDRISEITGHAICAPTYRPALEVDAGAAANALDLVIGSDPSGLCAISPSTFPGSAHGEWGIWVPEQLHPAFETELAKHGHDGVDG